MVTESKITDEMIALHIRTAREHLRELSRALRNEDFEVSYEAVSQMAEAARFLDYAIAAESEAGKTREGSDESR
jgi:hypothetical protein